MRRVVLTSFLVVAVLPGIPALGHAAGSAHRAPTAVDGLDFDNDGFDDMAVGVEFEDIAAPDDAAGAVHAFYGSAAGLSASNDQFWTENSPGVPDTVEQGDLFGAGLAGGDFNGDGFDDLAIGAIGEDIGVVQAAGAVFVLPGSASGLTGTGSQMWSQDSPGILDQADDTDFFGDELTTGDFDGDGFDDLVVGIPLEDAPQGTMGSAAVLYGSAAGLTSAGNQFWNQDSPGILDSGEGLDAFGSSVAAGDLDGDGFDDLAVGVDGETLAGDREGAVNVIYGSAGAGLTSAGDQFWNQDSPGILDTAQFTDFFGSAVSIGDLDADGFGDLAVGVVGESLSGEMDAGAVNVLYGSAGVGLTAAGDQLWHQDVAGVIDTAEDFDNLGGSLATGDFDGDGFSDLAMGASSEDIGGATAAGAANVLYGSGAGLTATGDQFPSQNANGVIETPELGDGFAFSLTTGDYDGDGFSEMAAGVWEESIGSISEAGGVNVLYGSAGVGLTADGDQFPNQNADGVLDDAETEDRFGVAIA